MKPMCKTCVYYSAGDCRRRSPGVFDASFVSAATDRRVFETATAWPTVAEDHWCGEYLKRPDPLAMDGDELGRGVANAGSIT